MGETFPDLRWHLPNLIPEGLAFLVGGPKLGKSWLTHELALATSTGGAFLTETLDARPVLHLALEDSDRRLKSRTTKLGYGTARLGEWHYVTRLPAERSARHVITDWVERLPTGCPAPLVIIDTLGRVRRDRRPTETPYDHDYRIGIALKSLADAIDGMALVVVHHDRKAQSADFVDDVSGTNGLAGSADTIIVIRRERTSPEGVLLVTGREVTEDAYAMRFEAGLWTLRGDSWEQARKDAAETAASTGRGDLAAQIVAWLAVHDAGKPAEIAEALGASPAAVRQALSRIARAGLLDRQAGVYFLPADSSTPPERNNDEP
jgi:hypothetical protein